MKFHAIWRSLLTFVLSLSLILQSRNDMGMSGLVFFLAAFSLLFFRELYIIRSALLVVYAEALTDSKLLQIFLKHKLINGVLTLFISFYFAIHLLLFSYISPHYELVLIGLCGLTLVAITPSLFKNWFKPGPAEMFGKVFVIAIFVLFAILIDGVYTVSLPIDSRIRWPFDENIPIYVIADVRHSVPYFQHLLRSIAFLNMNIDSIELCAQSDFNVCSNMGPWFHIVRFIYALSPTPYIAVAMILLSIKSILNIKIDRE